MIKPYFNVLYSVFIAVGIVNCARVGSITGGLKDETAPVVVKEKPANKSTNFTEKSFKIYFDEYVQLSDPIKEIFISPPLKSFPKIRPAGSAFRHIELIINDTLADNTTYVFDFGKSIKDFNEGNTIENYTYVFSTGKYIDSLEIWGAADPSGKRDNSKAITLVLHEIDSTFNDSAIFNKNPTYVTKTIDTLTEFNLRYIHPGKYRLYALLDENKDYKYTPPKEQIGFYTEDIDLGVYSPDKYYRISLFNEELPFKSNYPVLSAKNRIAFPYEGNPKNARIELISDVAEDFRYKVLRQIDHDSIDVWFTPLKTFLEDPEKKEEKDSLKIRIDSIVNNRFNNLYSKSSVTDNLSKTALDSLKLKIKDSITRSLKDSLAMGREKLSRRESLRLKKAQKELQKLKRKQRSKTSKDSLMFTVYDGNKLLDTFKVRFKRMYMDSLKLNPSTSGTLSLRDSFYIQMTTPIEKITDSLVSFIDKDTLDVSYKLVYKEDRRRLYFDFESEPNGSYQMQLLPGVVEDMFGQKNDTINLVLSTKGLTDYANVRFKIKNVPYYPFILQLLKSDYSVYEEQYVERPKEFHEFSLLDPGTYVLGMIFDKNKNKKWDTGNVLRHRQPEEKYYFPEIELQANFEVEQEYVYEKAKDY